MERGAGSSGSWLKLDPQLFRQSQFWILTGLLSIGVAISSMSKRFTNSVRGAGMASGGGVWDGPGWRCCASNYTAAWWMPVIDGQAHDRPCSPPWAPPQEALHESLAARNELQAEVLR